MAGMGFIPERLLVVNVGTHSVAQSSRLEAVSSFSDGGECSLTSQQQVNTLVPAAGAHCFPGEVSFLE